MFWRAFVSLFLNIFSEDFLGFVMVDDDGILFFGRFKVGSAPGIKDDLPSSKKRKKVNHYTYRQKLLLHIFQHHRSSINLKYFLEK